MFLPDTTCEYFRRPTKPYCLSTQLLASGLVGRFLSMHCFRDAVHTACTTVLSLPVGSWLGVFREQCHMTTATSIANWQAARRTFFCNVGGFKGSIIRSLHIFTTQILSESGSTGGG